MTRDEMVAKLQRVSDRLEYLPAADLRGELADVLAALSTPAPVAPDDALVSGDVAAFLLPEVADSDEAGPCVTCGAVLGATMQTLEADPPPLWRHAVTECNEAHIALDVAGVPKSQQMRRVRGPDGDEDVTIGLKERIRRLALMSPAPQPAKPTGVEDEGEGYIGIDFDRANDAVVSITLHPDGTWGWSAVARGNAGHGYRQPLPEWARDVLFAAPAPVEPPPAVAGIDWDAERDRCAFPSYKE